ncbi:protein SPT2 homolog [Abrus precatorius]|uniref:Protein SPT2 homolog n=1 Tax=Abrus precatorius TaxID=3816 RepID=A0A8B8KT39_ABRPR|nr:protein SPT2 homolog [Abrus precatorius]XP_027347047.1 protein SPT2 homolog [Abrus precatorius]
MRGYDNERDEYDDYYEDEGQEEYEEEGEEEYEEEEQEPRKPSKEEMEYLELRQKLKESIRKQMKKDSSGSSTSRLDSTDRRKNKLPYDNYGSFFGPSQPVIAQRVIQESKSMLENKHLASRVSNPHQIKKNHNKVSNGGSKSSSHNLPPKVNEMKVKAQKLKNTRDYSFLLSDDAELPAPSKAPPPRNMPIRNSEGRPAQVPARSKQQPLSNGSKLVRPSHEERKRGSAAGHLPPKSGSSYKTSSTSKPSMASADSRKQLGNNSVNGPGRPAGPKGMPSKNSVGITGNKSSTLGIKTPVNGMQKSLPSKAHPSIPKQNVEQRKDIRELNRPKMTPKQPVASSKPQMNKPLKQNSMHTASQDYRPKHKVARRHYDDAEDDMDISNMIRSMFNYNPKKFVDDDDDDDMEAGFDEIMREERRSAKIAKKEDEEQLRLIEEEEERERRRRMAKLKKRKHGE